MTENTETKPVWDGTPKGAMRAFLVNDLYVAIEAAKLGMNVDVSQVVEAVLVQLDKIARESYPLHQARTDADLVLHAEGPGAAERLPWLSALNWLSTTSERALKTVAANWLDMKTPTAAPWSNISTCA